MRCLNVYVFLIVLAYQFVFGYKILGFFGYKGKSHFDIFEPLMKALAAKGHEVTVVSYFPQKVRVTNYADVVISEEEIFVDVVDMEYLSRSRFQQYTCPFLLTYLGVQSCKQGLFSNNVTDFLNSNKHFDLVITELFNTECFLNLLHQFKAPMIGISSCNIMAWDDFTVGVPSNPAYIPVSFMPFTDRMTFTERVENTFIYILSKVVFELLINMSGRVLASAYFNSTLPDLKAIAANISLMLVSNHFSVTLPRPLPPNYIEIGGIHIGTLRRPPPHLEKWINESEHGVIYFSLGSMIKGHTFPEDKKQMFINAFNRLPQRVLWKWENETMAGKTDNIMIEKWMPQFDILCHPNVKAFIGHGGMLGVTEAVHCGVPMIVMPQYGDQFTNAKALEANGGGIVLDYRYLDDESVYNALTAILDPKFNKKAKELSARFKDRPLPPLETAIYWIEYVARHGGAPHLRTAAVGMPLYQYLLLDVIAFLSAILFSFIFIVYYISRTILRKMCKRSSKKVKKN